MVGDRSERQEAVALGVLHCRRLNYCENCHRRIARRLVYTGRPSESRLSPSERAGFPELPPVPMYERARASEAFYNVSNRFQDPVNFIVRSRSGLDCMPEFAVTENGN